MPQLLMRPVQPGTEATNVHDGQRLPDLLHGNETRVYGDSAYAGQDAGLYQPKGLSQSPTK